MKVFFWFLPLLANFLAISYAVLLPRRLLPQSFTRVGSNFKLHLFKEPSLTIPFKVTPLLPHHSLSGHLFSCAVLNSHLQNEYFLHLLSCICLSITGVEAVFCSPLWGIQKKFPECLLIISRIVFSGYTMFFFFKMKKTSIWLLLCAGHYKSKIFPSKG